MTIDTVMEENERQSNAENKLWHIYQKASDDKDNLRDRLYATCEVRSKRELFANKDYQKTTEVAEEAFLAWLWYYDPESFF